MGWTFVPEGSECAMDAPNERNSSSIINHFLIGLLRLPSLPGLLGAYSLLGACTSLSIRNFLHGFVAIAVIVASSIASAETAIDRPVTTSAVSTSAASTSAAVVVGSRQQVVHHAVVFQGQVRSYSVYLPCEFSQCVKGKPIGGEDSSEKRFPVVLAFHGVMMNAETMAEMTDLHLLGFRNGFIVVYLDGDGHGRFRTWNSGGRSGRLERIAEDDVGFVRLVLRGLEADYPIDSNRIHATGFSNGGMMCYRLAVEMPEVIASIAPVAGTLAVPLRSDGCPESAGGQKRAVPSLHIHGTEDKFVPWTGPNARTPKNLDFCSVPQTVQAWVRHHSNVSGLQIGCESGPFLDRCADGTRIDSQIFRLVSGDEQDVVAIELVRVAGGGHTWPGGKNREWLVGTTSREFSANERMWEFFQRHPLQ